jgi:hypothetical protein
VKVPATIRWVALALLGLLIAAGVSIAASSLVSQQIGLDSEPISAGDALAPQASSQPNRHEGPRHKASPAKAPTEPAPAGTTAPSPPGSTEPQPPPAPTSTIPVAPVPPSGSGASGGEQDHGGGGGGAADD